ncbi:MAG: single-stranded DNA-binding protein [Bacteroidia bacterium]|nr:single-stranded DNA-binding protein [Bacteroidia bacterium]
MEKLVNKMVNRVELNGFAGINPEVVTLNEGVKIARFTLATTRNYKNRDGEWTKDTTWHKIVLWNKLADQAQTLIKKGSHINLTGKIVNRTYIDKSGEKRFTTEIFGNSFETIINEPKLKIVA